MAIEIPDYLHAACVVNVLTDPPGPRATFVAHQGFSTLPDGVERVSVGVVKVKLASPIQVNQLVPVTSLLESSLTPKAQSVVLSPITVTPAPPATVAEVRELLVETSDKDGSPADAYFSLVLLKIPPVAIP